MASVTEQALRVIEEEKRAALVEEQKRTDAAQAEAAAKAQAERAVRVQLQAERELARIAAERALAAEEAAAVQAAEALALQAELKRLRARSEIEILRDEMAQMRAEQMATLKAYHLARVPQQEIHLRTDGELDMRFKSSKEELATARAEIAELKKQMDTLFSGRFILRPANNPDGAFCGNGEIFRWRPSDGPDSNAVRHPTMAHWQIERV